MAKLPGYLNTQVTRQQVQGVQKTTNNNLSNAINSAVGGITQLAQVQNQMQERESRDYVIGQQNKTKVALAEQRIAIGESSATGSEYTNGLKTFIEKQKSAAIESSPTPKAAEATTKYFDSLLANEMEHAIPVAAKMNAKNTANVINESLEIGLNQTYRNPNDFEESLENAHAVIDSSDLPDNVKETAKSQYQEKLMTQKLLGVINKDPRQAVKDINSGAYDSIEPNKLNQITEAAKGQSEALTRQEEINRNKYRQAQEAQRNADNARVQSDLEIGVSRGEFGYIEIEKAFESGVITPSKRTSLTKSVDSQVRSMENKNDNIEKVTALVESGMPLSYRDTEQKGWVDDYYANMPDSVKSEPNAIASLVKSTKVIPSQVETALNAGIKGSVTQTIAASDLISRMNEQSPEVIAQLPSDTKTMGIAISRLVAGGVEPAKAVELANNSVYNTTPEFKSVLKAQLPETTVVRKKAAAFKSTIKKLSPSFFTPDRTASTDRMEASFNFMADQYYLKTHDMDAATELAAADISQVWGPTWVGGKEVMTKYPIEKMYGNGEESEWIYNQLEAEAHEAGATGKISLQSDPTTARSSSPSYVVMEEKDGVMIPFYKDGILQTFTPDYNLTPEKKAADKAKTDAMEKARKVSAYKAGNLKNYSNYGIPQ